jgi:hypothetical protein
VGKNRLAHVKDIQKKLGFSIFKTACQYMNSNRFADSGDIFFMFNNETQENSNRADYHI